MKRSCVQLLTLSITAATTFSATAITVAGFSSAEHNRFANSSSFILDSDDLSGVAIASNGAWVTMVSPNVFLTSAHYVPPNGSSVTFYQGNDPTGPSVTRNVSFTQALSRGSAPTLDTTDIHVGVLDQALPIGYATYSYATTNMTVRSQFGRSDYFGATGYLFGKGPSPVAGAPNITVGTNILDDFVRDAQPDVAGNNDPVDPALTTVVGGSSATADEAALQGGDSGGPMFVRTAAGELELVGLNWYIGTIGADSVNGFSYVGNWDLEIDQFVAANIPEPSTGLVVCALGLGLLGHRSRRSQ